MHVALESADHHEPQENTAIDEQVWIVVPDSESESIPAHG